MGDLLQKEMLGDLVINVINILILFFVARALLYKPVKKFLAARREKERSSLESAETARQEAEALKAEYEKALTGVEEKKAQLLDETRQAAEQDAARIREDAVRRAERICADAEAEAGRTVEKAKREAQKEVADLAVDLSGRVLGREVTDEDNRAIIDSFFAQLGGEA